MVLFRPHASIEMFKRTVHATGAEYAEKYAIATGPFPLCKRHYPKLLINLQVPFFTNTSLKFIISATSRPESLKQVINDLNRTGGLVSTDFISTNTVSLFHIPARVNPAPDFMNIDRLFDNRKSDWVHFHRM